MGKNKDAIGKRQKKRAAIRNCRRTLKGSVKRSDTEVLDDKEKVGKNPREVTVTLLSFLILYVLMMR